MTRGVEVEISARGIATLLLNRPERSNAIDQATLDELARQFSTLAADERARVVLLRGSGKHFCAGADLVARASAPEPSAAPVQTTIVDMLAALAACCDVVVAADGAFFSIPEVRIGMAPLGVTPFVIRAIGHRSFRRYGLSGERFGAPDALRIGLAHEVVPAEQLDAKVAEVVDALLHGAPNAQRTLKDGMERFVGPTVEAIVAARPSHGSTRTPEALEGIASFKEKRKPSWYPQ